MALHPMTLMSVDARTFWNPRDADTRNKNLHIPLSLQSPTIRSVASKYILHNINRTNKPIKFHVYHSLQIL